MEPGCLCMVQIWITEVSPKLLSHVLLCVGSLRQVGIVPLGVKRKAAGYFIYSYLSFFFLFSSTQKWNFRLVFSAELDKHHSFQHVVALAEGRFTRVGGNLIYLHKWRFFREVLPCCVVLMPNLFGNCNALTHGQKMIPAWKTNNSISYSLWQCKILHICLQMSSHHEHHCNINGSSSYIRRIL